MNQRLLWIGLASVMVGAVLTWVLVASRPPAADGGAAPEELPTPPPAPEQRILLLFPGPDGLLHPELRTAPFPAELDLQVRTVVTELLAGPAASDGELVAAVPWPAALEASFVDGQGNAFVDLTAPPGPVAGSHTELTLVYAVVDSVLLNCPELRAVQLLFGGHEVATLTGHLDLSRPLVLNKRFIAAS